MDCRLVSQRKLVAIFFDVSSVADVLAGRSSTVGCLDCLLPATDDDRVGPLDSGRATTMAYGCRRTSDLEFKYLKKSDGRPRRGKRCQGGGRTLKILPPYPLDT
jgi:hypothetical protein